MRNLLVFRFAKYVRKGNILRQKAHLIALLVTQENTQFLLVQLLINPA